MAKQSVCTIGWMLLVLSNCVLQGSSNNNIKPTVSWDIHCETSHAEEGCSIEKLEGCSYQDNFNRMQEEILSCHKDRPTSRIEMTPFFNKSSIFYPYANKENCANEPRWRPGLNISWLTGQTMKDQEFFVMIAYMDNGRNEPDDMYHQCFKIKVPGTSGKAGNPNQPASKRITLLSRDFSENLHLLGDKFCTVHVNVENVTNPSKTVLEARYHAPLDGNGVNGLPIYMRGIVPEVCMETSELNPRLWLAPLTIYNSSCEREIEIQFPLMPQNDKVSSYKVILLDFVERYKEKQIFTQKLNDGIGVLTFRNLSSKEYYFIFELDVTDPYCPTSSESKYCDINLNSPGCLIIAPRRLMIQDPVEPSFSRQVQVFTASSSALNTPGLVSIVVISCLALLFLLAAIATYYRRYRVNWSLSKPPTPAQIEAELSEKTIYLMYSNDNQYHQEVVLKLADLLQQEGHVKVILDAWTTAIPSSMYDWILTKINNSSKVILVGSEAAVKYLEAHRKNLYWPKLEESTPLSKMFPLGVKALLQSQSNCPHSNSTKVMLASFEYSRKTERRMPVLEQLAGNNMHYRLPEDVESLLMGLHDKPKHSPGSWVHQWAKDVLKTEAGEKLAGVIREAVNFHKDNPEWFKEMFGEAVAFGAKQKTQEESKGNKWMNGNTELDALWKGPYNVAKEGMASTSVDIPNFTPPEEVDNRLNEKEDLGDRNWRVFRMKSSDSEGDNSLGKTDSGLGMVDSDRDGNNSPSNVTDTGKTITEEECTMLLPSRNFLMCDREELKMSCDREMYDYELTMSDDAMPFIGPSSLSSTDSAFLHI